MCAAQDDGPLQLAYRLVPGLVSGTVAVILAQLFKADLAKGWAAWLQALVTIGCSFGAMLIVGICRMKVLPTPFIRTCMHVCGCVCPEAMVAVWLQQTCCLWASLGSERCVPDGVQSQEIKLPQGASEEASVQNLQRDCRGRSGEGSALMRFCNTVNRATVCKDAEQGHINNICQELCAHASREVLVQVCAR